MSIPHLRRMCVPGVVLALALFSGSPAMAQNEQETVGFQENHFFEAGQFGEGIDILNGGLNLTFPIGPRYQVNSRLGYQLSLSYNSKIWNSETYNHPEIARIPTIRSFFRGRPPIFPATSSGDRRRSTATWVRRCLPAASATGSRRRRAWSIRWRSVWTVPPDRRRRRSTRPRTR